MVSVGLTCMARLMLATPNILIISCPNISDEFSDECNIKFSLFID